MTTLQVIAKEVTEIAGIQHIVLEVQEYVGERKGRRQMISLNLPITERDMLEFLKYLYGAKTVVFQHTYLLEKETIEGVEYLVVH